LVTKEQPSSCTASQLAHVVCVIGIKFRRGESQQSAVPLSVHVCVHLEMVPQGPGNMHPTVVTLRRLATRGV